MSDESVADPFESLQTLWPVEMSEAPTRAHVLSLHANPDLIKTENAFVSLLLAEMPHIQHLWPDFVSAHGLIAPHGLMASPTLAPWSLEWILVDDAAIQALNAEHRAKNTPTDVLSFPLFENATLGDDHAEAASPPPALEALPPEVLKGMKAQGGTLGSVVVSLDYARANVRAPQSLLAYALARFIHGSLHCYGQHHATQEDYATVLRLQQDFLTHFEQKEPST